MDQVYTIGQVLSLIERSYQNDKAIVTHIQDGWKALSTADFLEEVKYISLALAALGVKKGDKVGIVAIPSGRWTIADFAIMSIGAISVPIFANISEENFLFEVNQTELKTAFVGGEDQWALIQKHATLFQNILSIDDRFSMKEAISYQDLLRKGRHEEAQNLSLYKTLLKAVNPKDDATIIYTSGSTGVPKGVLHTHHSLTSLLHTPMFHWSSKDDRFLSFLPLAHVFARVLNLIMVTWGISVYYYNDIKNLSPICQEIHPTVLVVVPRLLERMYDKMIGKVRSASPVKRAIGSFAFHEAHQSKPSFLGRFLHPLLDELVYKNLRAALGGKLRVVFCGGAALNPSLYQFYLNAGFPIFEGWGLTEGCPITVNCFGHIKVGSVGLPILGMKVKTSTEGELLVSGEMVMKEYYKSEKATKDAFTEDGWFRTGDKGSIDQEGYVTILGRIKELFKTSTGEMVAPIPIEQALGKSPFVDTALVIADNRKFVSCLIVPDFEALKAIKEKQGLSNLSDMEFLNSTYTKKEFGKTLQELNSHLNSWEKVKDYRFLPEPLSVESGELTPSLKTKRDVIEKKYKNLVDSMYKELT